MFRNLVSIALVGLTSLVIAQGGTAMADQPSGLVTPVPQQAPTDLMTPVPPRSSPGQRGMAVVPPMKGVDDPARQIALKLLSSISGQVQDIHYPGNRNNFYSLMRSQPKLSLGLLIVCGHGSFDLPRLDFADQVQGLENSTLFPEDIDTEEMQSEIAQFRGYWSRHLQAGRPPDAAVREMTQRADKLRELVGISSAMKPGAQVLFINCAAAYSDKGKGFCRNLARLLVGCHGGFVRASTSNVGIAPNKVEGNLLHELLVFGPNDLKVHGNWLDFHAQAEGLPPVLELKWDDATRSVSSGNKGQLRVCVRGTNIPPGGLPITLRAYDIPGKAPRQHQQTLTMSAARPEVELVVSNDSDPAGAHRWWYMVEAPKAAPLLGKVDFNVEEKAAETPSAVKGPLKGIGSWSMVHDGHPFSGDIRVTYDAPRRRYEATLNSGTVFQFVSSGTISANGSLLGSHADGTFRGELNSSGAAGTFTYGGTQGQWRVLWTR